MTLTRSQGGVTVTVTGALADLAAPALDRLVADGVPAKMLALDADLWGPDARGEAARRLGWIHLATSSRPLLGPLADLHEQLRAEGLDRIVLCGMGGSSLAPEVICATAGVPLVAVDTTDPAQVRAAMADLDRTVVVVSSKSGGTLETDSHYRAFRRAFQDAGIEPAARIVVVTDPESPLEATATEQGVRAVFRANPDVGGRYSALTAFGLVPSALAGVDVAALLDDAEAVLGGLGSDDSPALLLGAALGAGAVAGRDKVVLSDGGSGIDGFGDWAEQLVAESTGKQGKGLLPVVVGAPDAPGDEDRDDSHRVRVGGTAPDPGSGVSGPLGAQFLAWEFAVAVAGRVIGIDPFDQPNVQESKDNTNNLLEQAGDGPLPDGEPAFTDGPVAVYGDRAVLGDATSLPAAITALLAQVDSGGYLAVMAYLDRLSEAPVAGVRAALAARLPHPVTFGWGPRFLHSTGQFHKGGPQVGVFLQVTAEPDGDVTIPGRPFDFARLQHAQWLGDLHALEKRHRPVVRVHLTDRAAGIAALLEAVEAR
ncbi:MAG TPA: glucose-6-phosphate isomerase [Mycobacteriales bacterium]